MKFGFGKTNRRVYLDHASLTPIDGRVLKVMNQYSSAQYANPSALHAEGVAARAAMGEARKECARQINAHEDEIFFTASGTEANNLAIRGMLNAHVAMQKAQKFSEKEIYLHMHIVTSVIEHQSVLESVRVFEARGVKVDYVPVNEEGIVDLVELKKLIRPDTVLVSIMQVNNEVGSIQPIKEIAKIVRDARKSFSSNVVFHTDASQGFAYNEFDVTKMNVDLVTFDSHKVFGPRGVGMLYVKRGTALSPIISGGGQEKGLRSGTENLPGIMGFAEALKLCSDVRKEETARINDLRQQLADEIVKSCPDTLIYGPRSMDLRAPHILSIGLPAKYDPEFFVLNLDARGIACATKSACLRDVDESYVLKAMGKDGKHAVRLSCGRTTTKSDIEYTAREFAKVYRALGK